MKNLKAIQSARALLRSKEKAILSTHSVSKSGYPFGSATTFISDYMGNPIIYISHLAQHTKNIKQDPKLSLIITEDNEDDINAGARLTLLGKAQLIHNSEIDNISEKFWARFPESKKYQNTHDFKFYRICVEHVRYIAGFGQIYWLPVSNFLLNYPSWTDNEKHAIDHMNRDHVDAMQIIISHYKNIKTDNVLMTHIYADGCIIKADNKTNHFLAFNSEVKKSSDIRKELVNMTIQARS